MWEASFDCRSRVSDVRLSGGGETGAAKSIYRLGCRLAGAARRSSTILVAVLLVLVFLLAHRAADCRVDSPALGGAARLSRPDYVGARHHLQVLPSIRGARHPLD